MGQSMSLGLTQEDVEELVRTCHGAFNQKEIETLYRRFRTLDRARKGFITSEEFLSIPELSINPLAKRLSFFFESINFTDFIMLLAPFSRRASRDEKLRLMFSVLDVDGDGYVSADDLRTMLGYMAGSSLDHDQVTSIIDKVVDDAGVSARGLSLAAYKEALDDVPINLHVDVPQL